ncbi:DUF2628 domain-containing protein [Lederbergia panacisoli]|uniref:DUF2628 domain-containing protein n=1 Tax=Lederbergia panacisoli TaxID=1255251 RepID=UPI00214B661A|nr:DUF2628 domain-containing protein [Lederbergia panacisoli]MCR2823634.1 DUF2628 domain-containing protein [Lederbergia panacisoli]
MSETDKKELKYYVGEKSDLYFRRWETELGEVSKTSWNFSAFFLTVFWAAYRKMYGLAIGILIAFFIIDIIASSTGMNDVLYVLIVWGTVGLFLGLFGNYLYYKHAKKKIRKLNRNSQNFWDEIDRVGGTSFKGVLIGIVLYMAYGFLASTLLY